MKDTQMSRRTERPTYRWTGRRTSRHMDKQLERRKVFRARSIRPPS